MSGSGRTRKGRLDLPRFGKTGDEPVTYRDLDLFARRLQDWADNLKLGRIGVATYEDGRYHVLANTWTADPWPFDRLAEDSNTFSKRQPAGLNDIFEVPPGLGGNYAMSWRFGAYQYTTTVTTKSYTGAKQTFTVPAGVTFLELDVKGAQGGTDSTSVGGKGGRVTGKIDVTAGDVLDIYVGGQGATSGAGGYPNGGAGGYNGTTADAPGGGGASFVTPSGGTVADAYIVAGAGGGGARYGPSNHANGGYGGFAPTAGQEGYNGLGANNWSGSNGQPATSTAGGAGGNTGTGSPGEAGDTDGVGQGGDGGTHTNAFAFAGGGGGGGYHGGGGGVDPAGAGNYGGGGGGGISYLSADVYDEGWTDDYQSGAGEVIITYYTLTPHDTTLTHVELMLARRDYKVADQYSQVEVISTDAGDPMHGAIVLPLGEGDRFWLRVTNTDTNVLYKENFLSAYRIAD